MFTGALALDNPYKSARANPDDTLLPSILKELCGKRRNHGGMVVQLVEASRRHSRRFDEMERRFAELEHRFGDLAVELELMLKGELTGRLTHFETVIDEKRARLSDRLQVAEGQK